MKKTLYFDKVCDISAYAATEDGRLTECAFAKDDGAPAVGNIYRGTVVNVLDGMQAAFVDCGLERNCYLAADDVTDSAGIKAGDEVMVQVIKPPCGKKGAKVTMKISLVGRSLIYLPNSDFVGISHRIGDDELKSSLIMAAKRARREGEGIVVRNSAPFCRYETISAELEYLRKLYQSVEKNYAAAPAGTLIHSDFAMPTRILRDFAPGDVETVVVGSAELLGGVEQILTADGFAKVRLHDGRRDMFEELGLLAQVKEVCLPRVNIGGGAYLIMERTEALTSVDVNTGGFTGEDNLEYTVYHTNLAAAREIARQVKLRDIGGLVVVDFIDMASPAHRKAIVAELQKELAKDGAPFRVLPMSEFGLVEFTRKRTGPGLAEFALKKCPHCGATTEFSDDFFALEARAVILRALDGGAEKLCAELPAEACAALAANSRFAADISKRFPAAEVYLLPCGHARSGEIRCRAVKKAPAGAVKFV